MTGGVRGREPSDSLGDPTEGGVPAIPTSPGERCDDDDDAVDDDDADDVCLMLGVLGNMSLADPGGVGSDSTGSTFFS